MAQSGRKRNATITAGQLRAELAPYIDDAPVWLSIGVHEYPVDCVITGDGKIYLETNVQLGRPPKYATEEERLEARRESYRQANERRRRKA